MLMMSTVLLSYSYVYLKLFQTFGWKQVGALTEDGGRYPEYISLLQTLLERNGIKLASNRKFPRDKNKQNMTEVCSHSEA